MTAMMCNIVQILHSIQKVSQLPLTHASYSWNPETRSEQNESPRLERSCFKGSGEDDHKWCNILYKRELQFYVTKICALLIPLKSSRSVQAKRLFTYIYLPRSWRLCLLYVFFVLYLSIYLSVSTNTHFNVQPWKMWIRTSIYFRWCDVMWLQWLMPMSIKSLS